MKLVKSLLLSSAAGITAVAGAQAADLPFRKAAPVEYVRVCDYTGAGYWYIPGTDTCLKIEGYSRTDYAFIEPTKAFFPSFGASFTVPGSSGATSVFAIPGSGAGTVISARSREASGLREEGRVAVDTRTQTAYGTLRTYIRFQADATGGNFSQNPAGAAITNPTGASGAANAAYIDKAFVQFAGFTAGRVQSFFDFYADNYNFEGIANSDVSTEVFAYTATFGNGFSATLSFEERDNRIDGVRNTVDPFSGVSTTAAVAAGGTGAATTTTTFGQTNGVYAGEEIPDIVGAVRLDQAWGAVQLSGAYHEVQINETATVGDVINSTTTQKQKDGFAVQAGVQIKLPMLAAGDDVYLEGAYGQGTYRYVDSSGNLNAGFNSLAVGGFVHQDADAIVFRDGANGVSSGLDAHLLEAYSAMAAFHHYFTPNFSDVLFGSYLNVDYGRRAENLDWTLGGLGRASEYRIGNQFIWTPVNNLSIGVEVIYMHIDQTIAHNPGVAATPLPIGIDKNPDAFEGRLRVERDF